MNPATAPALDGEPSAASRAGGPAASGSAPGGGPPTLAGMVAVRGRFHRSVHLARDWDSGFEREFFATPALVEIAEQIVGELGRPRGTRAWTVTGPYGAGKSAFALFLARLLASRQPANEAARALRSRRLGDAPPLLPLLIQAERAPLAPAILAAVAEAPELGLGRRSRQFSSRPSGCVDLLVEAAARSEGGVALIVDELGKYLEYAASRPNEDVFLLQQLAEAAARCDKPLLFVSVLHSGFGDYVAAGDPARRAEWQKVQGRFRDVSFSLPAEQLLQLVGHAIERRLPRPDERAYRRRLRALAEKPGLREAAAWKGAEASLLGCLPLHPVTALLMWPLFRSKVAQNERSLFAFLSSHEPHGFQEFLRAEAASVDAPPLYRLPRLYDYVAGALGMAAFTGQDARFWGLIDHALERVPASAPPAAARLVKCVALLSLYGLQAGLRPDRDVLFAALDDDDEAELDASLQLLERESIVLFRRHRRCYGLWEGSDVDLEAAFEQGLAQRGREPLYRRLQRAVEPRPLVARAHYIQTGTLRFFEPRVAAPTARSCEEVAGSATQADGLLLFLVGDEAEGRAAGDGGSDGAAARSARELSRALSKLQPLHGKPVLVAIPRRVLELGEALDELEAWRWVRENVGELAGDSVARGEVAARESAARERFEQVAGATLGLPRHVLDPGACRWFHGGEEVAVPRPRDLQERLSLICRETYGKSPPLHNELLNRQNLSSAAARARRELIERLILYGDRERLGIEGFPPEYSMYRSLLVAGDFHRQPRGKAWRVCRPSGDWLPAWREIEAFVRGSRDGRRSLDGLMSRLEAPPFGLRRGPIPILIAVLLRIRGARLALYEDDLFVPRIEIETLERLVRRPETFSIRTYELNRDERHVIQVLGAHEAGVAADPEAGATSELLPIVRNLVRIAARLPPYARRTRRLSASARAVRQRLLDARDPRRLLLEELPAALGVNLDDEDGPQDFARLLGGAVRELTRALPDLLEEVERRVRDTFGFEERGAELRKALQAQVRPLVAHARLRKLQLFLGAAARADGRNLGEWRSTIALAIGDGLPPEHWGDELADSLGARLRALRLELDELADVVRVDGGDPTVAVGSLRVRLPGSGERRLAFPCPDGERTSVESLLDRWREAARAGEAPPGVQMQALALLAHELGPRTDETTAPAVERRAS
ncbi:MAG: hypothetical protein OXH70_11855 [Acidobacteria bacterium]|nr:hypothetical protein [Acidobacteriota bacterium]